MRPRLIVTCLIATTLVSCGTIGRGDSDGLDTTFEVTLGHAFVESISEKQILIGDGPGADQGKEASFGFGHGTWYSTTEVELHAGTRPGSGNLFIRELGWGDNTWRIPLRPGRQVHLSVRVFGGRYGAIALDPIEIPTSDAPMVSLDLTTAVPADLPRAEGE